MRRNSYMNQKNILSEGFFDKLANIFKRTKPKKQTKKLKKHQKDIKKTLDDINKEIYGLEKGFEKLYGKKFKFSRMTVNDL